ncbi:MAG TPA: O-antigen ligase family protein [Abditibacterium sp.]|jgi:O-antigen ligase
MDNVFLILGLIYALTFWILGWRYPGIALALIFSVAPFANDLAGGVAGVKFSFAEVNLVLALPLLGAALLKGDKQIQGWPFLWPCVIYFTVCVASAIFVQWRGNAALTSMFQMVLFLFVLIPVFSILARRPEDLLLALWGLLGSAAFIALNVLVTRSPYVLGLHKNNMGGSLSCAFIVGFELWFHYRDKESWHKRALLVLLLIISGGLLMTLSRGGWLAAISGAFFITLLRRQFAAVGRFSLLLVPLLAVAWLTLPQESRSYATSFDASRGNISQRYINQDIAMSFFESNPILGGGLGIRKEFDATQLVLFTLAETGVLGLLTFAAMFVAFFAMIWKTQKRFAHGEMSFSLLAIAGALMLSRLGHGMVDHYWQRGPTMMAWATAGMATGVFLYGPKTAYSTRLKRARALLALHLLEMKRRGQNVPLLSRRELQQANEALSLVLSERGVDAASAVSRIPATSTSPSRKSVSL